ncbi:hypothetical protein Moror_3269 [Moniliophthora roreri MCA 2997]|uniref:Uncharacterized protein n=1 Tax=Moniliophthora roreri (strain MCA 2997) TaxID=1381753 RepID=V2WRT3_MONRO|nr:hypothetical protein Moror_3269 [Moniliophthora roreri MCA 2997]KAI3621333.1 hypothetical protein WG66_014567 [Moniliophthora roreri]
MAGTKRSAPDSSGPTTRSSKTPKTNSKAGAGAESAKKGGAKKGGAKSTLPASQFKAKALPLHVNVTHTPLPSADTEGVPAVTADPGYLGSLTLLPSNFNTGSYGWKGSKRITVELQNDSEEKEKVQVQLTFNATVLGSKDAPGEDGEEAKHDKEEEKAEEKDEEKEVEE